MCLAIEISDCVIIHQFWCHHARRSVCCEEEVWCEEMWGEEVWGEEV